jgi:hypothetical protein
MVGFSFVTPVTGLIRPNTGKEDDDDDVYVYIYICMYVLGKISATLLRGTASFRSMAPSVFI